MFCLRKYLNLYPLFIQMSKKKSVGYTVGRKYISVWTYSVYFCLDLEKFQYLNDNNVISFQVCREWIDNIIRPDAKTIRARYRHITFWDPEPSRKNARMWIRIIIGVYIVHFDHIPRPNTFGSNNNFPMMSLMKSYSLSPIQIRFLGISPHMACLSNLSVRSLPLSLYEPSHHNSV